MELPPPPLEIAHGKTISVLSISLLTEDHLRLREILGRSDFAYVLTQADTFRSAATALARQRFGVVLAEYDLCPNSWTDVLAITSDLTFSPSLIVTSRLADERRWAEALNL